LQEVTSAIVALIGLKVTISDRITKVKLLTKELERALPAYNRSKGMVRAKFFDPCGSFTWYVMEYTKKDRVFFGFVTSSMCPEGEFGSFSLDELESVKGPLGLGIERDLYFTPKPIKDIQRTISEGQHV